MNQNKKTQVRQGKLYLDGGQGIDYMIVKSSRRTMAVQITRDGRVVVRIPKEVSYEEGDSFAKKQGEWILKHRNMVNDRLEKKESEVWEDKTEILLYGEKKPLHLEQDYEASRIRVCDTGSRILVSGPLEQQEGAVKDALMTWYKKQARAYLTDKTSLWAKRMGVTFRAISIRDQVTRWGSCSSKGNINYNWKLILVPEELADYVVVHELSHRFHMDHSREFWNEVEQELPDYRLRRRRLQDYETIINQKY